MARHVDEDVALAAADEPARSAEGLLVVEAAVEDLAVDPARVRGGRTGEVVAGRGPDRSGGAGDERELRELHFRRRLRLAVHERLLALLVERLRGDPHAGPAVDAGLVDEEVAGDVGGEPT